MNIKWLIYGAIGLIIFVMMGRNPFEAKDYFVPQDPVKASLEKRAAGQPLESDGFMGIFGGGGSGGPNGFGGGTFGGAGLGAGIGGAPILPAQVAPPGGNMPQFQPQKPPTPTPSSPFDNLPTTEQDTDNQLNQTLPPGVWNKDEFRPNLTITDGRPIRFIGAHAFTLDTKGNVIRHPDGEFTLMNGARIIIRDGVNQWYPLQWKNAQG